MLVDWKMCCFRSLPSSLLSGPWFQHSGQAHKSSLFFNLHTNSHRTELREDIFEKIWQCSVSSHICVMENILQRFFIHLGNHVWFIYSCTMNLVKTPSSADFREAGPSCHRYTMYLSSVPSHPPTVLLSLISFHLRTLVVCTVPVSQISDPFFPNKLLITPTLMFCTSIMHR